MELKTYVQNILVSMKDDIGTSIKNCVVKTRTVKFKVIVGTLKLLIFAISKFVIMKIEIFFYKWNKRNKPKDIGKLLGSNSCNKEKLQ